MHNFAAMITVNAAGHGDDTASSEPVRRLLFLANLNRIDPGRMRLAEGHRPMWTAGGGTIRPAPVKRLMFGELLGPEQFDIFIFSQGGLGLRGRNLGNRR